MRKVLGIVVLIVILLNCGCVVTAVNKTKKIVTMPTVIIPITHFIFSSLFHD